MACSSCSGFAVGRQWVTLPWRSTRNLVKFHPIAPAADSGPRGLVVPVERVCILTVHVDLRHHREGDVVLHSAERGDLSLGAWFLIAELITGKPSTANPLAVRACSSSQTGILVNPHRLATLTMRTILPR